MLALHFFRPSGPRDLAGRLASLLTRSRYSHVAVEAGGEVYEALRDGFCKDPAPLERAEQAAMSWYWNVAERDEAQVVGFCEWLVGRRYGWWSIVGMWLSAALKLPLYLGRPSEHICSTAAAECLLIAGLFTGETRVQTPGSLARWAERAA